MRPNNNRSSRICPSVHEPKAQNVVVHLHHRVCSEDSPNHLFVLQNQVDGGHAGPQPRAPEAARLVTSSERRHRLHSRNLPELRREGLQKCVVDGGFQDGKAVDGADLGAADAVAVDGQEGGVYGEGLAVEHDGFDADEILCGFLAFGGDAGGADGVDEERGVGEGIGEFDVGQEAVGAVAGEDDAGESGGAAEADGEFSVEAKCGGELGREGDCGPSESGHAAHAAGEAFQKERRAAHEEEFRHRHRPIGCNCKKINKMGINLFFFLLWA